MKYLFPLAFAVAVAASGLSAQETKPGVEVTLIGPGGVRAPVTELIPEFERRTGYKVKATFGSGGATRQQVIKGFVSAHAKSPDGAKALLAFLSSPEAAATYRRLGMQPAR